MGYFDSFREDGRNTYHPGTNSVVWADVTQVTVVVICVVFSLALFIVVLGTRGKERLTNFLRLIFTLHAGIVSLVSLYSSEWQTARGMTHCSYDTRDDMELMAEVTVKVGLNSLNITLEGMINETTSSEAVSYNERFWFIDVSQTTAELEAAKERGLPSTIIYTLEFFSVDEGGLRWHRYIRQAGYFTLILLWSSFVMWIVFNLIFCFVALYGAALMSITGATMVTACILNHTLQPPTPLIIPFEDAFATLQKGWCFWLVLVSGLLTMLTGMVLMILCQLCLLPVSRVFLVDVTDLEEEEAEQRERFATQIDSPEIPRKCSMAYSNAAFNSDDLQRSPPPTLTMRHRYSMNYDRTTLNGSRKLTHNQSAPSLPRYRNTPSLASIFAPQMTSPEVIVENEASSGSGSDISGCDSNMPVDTSLSALTKQDPAEMSQPCMLNGTSTPSEQNRPPEISPPNPDAIRVYSIPIEATNKPTDAGDTSRIHNPIIQNSGFTIGSTSIPVHENRQPVVQAYDYTPDPVASPEVPHRAITIVDIREEDEEFT